MCIFFIDSGFSNVSNKSTVRNVLVIIIPVSICALVIIIFLCYSKTISFWLFRKYGLENKFLVCFRWVYGSRYIHAEKVPSVHGRVSPHYEAYGSNVRLSYAQQ